MVGTLTGLAVSLATPAMAASGGPAASAPTAVVTTTSSHAHHAGTSETGSRSALDQARLNVYAAYGYGYADAKALATLWETATPYDAKLIGGAKIKAGSTLPFPPKAAPTTAELTSLAEAKIGVFRVAGYGYADAEALAALWESPSVGAAKIIGGAKIKAGLTLPFPPESAPGASSGHHA